MSCSAKDSSRLNIKAPAEQPTSAPLSSVHTTRSPLSPIDLRRNSASSQVNSLPSELSRSISSDINSSAMREGSRQNASRGESRSNRTNNQNHAPNGFTPTTPQPQGNHQHTGSNVPDLTMMYLYNDSFSFGPQTPSNTHPSRPVDPVSPLHQSPSEESLAKGTNDTPRPSVVAQPRRDNPPNLISSHPPQETPSQPYRQTSPAPISPGGQRRVVKHRDRENTTTSPSASSTSLSSSGPMSRADSRTSYTTNTTNQTSSNDDDDIYRNSPSVTDEALSSTLGELSVRDLTSEDEYGGSEFEDEVYSDEDVVEIGSVHYEGGSSVSHEWERALYSGGTSGSGHLTIPGSARRGSLPSGMNVPMDPQDSFSSGRLREDSLATLRRPSRSLDDDEFLHIRRDRFESPHGIYGLDDPLSRPGVPSPASVPQSDSDWQRLESRSSTSSSYKGKEVDRRRQSSVQFEGGRPFIANGSSSHPSAPQEFDLDWTNMQGGITFLNSDEMADIVAPMDTRNPERKSSLSTLRFFNNLNFFGNNRRPSAATISTIHGDSFGRAIKKWDKNSRPGEWVFRKERAESGGVVAPGSYSPRASVVGDRAESLTSELTVTRPEKYNAPFKGMNLGSVELWRNELVGRFKVDRKETKPSDSAKGPQQRLIITSIPDPYIQNTDPLRGPPVTVHKHSKATAFSISRHYRWENKDNESGNSLAVPHGHKSRVLVPTSKKSSSMILLAPRRVQEAFTNTNTTRRLEYHGLLDDKEQEKRRQKAREKESRRPRRREESSNNRSRPSEQSRDDSVVGTETMNSSFSGVTLIAPPATAPAPQVHTYPPSYPSTSSEASTSRDSGLDRMSSHSSFASARRRRRINDPYNFDTDEDEVGDDFSVSRTPYTEVYSTVDSTSFEQQTRPDNESSDSIFSRLGLRRNQHNNNAGHISAYNPPWMTMAPRIKQEEQQRVVENLNTSFKDVGLLPSRERSKPGSSSRKSKKVSGRATEKVDIFKEVPPDVLYMLLPLWPGETDQKSREEYPFDKPVIPSKDRQYLMIYYKPFESSAADERKKNESESKKRSRGSQNSSHDSTLSQRDKAHILLSSFHITCRVVSYADLQGSGVRVPDDGLAVTGPLHEAFAKSGPVRGDNAEGEWAIGACHSREAGVEFYADTFWRMNLAIRYNEPDRGPVISEEEEYPEGDIELTPLGRAVMEMAWVGGMALASFG